MARTKGGRKRGARRLEYQSYIFRVENPEVSYGLSIDRKGSSCLYQDPLSTRRRIASRFASMNSPAQSRYLGVRLRNVFAHALLKMRLRKS